MRELIHWNIDLALLAWQQPDEYGRSYELRTRDKRAVKDLRLHQPTATLSGNIRDVVNQSQVHSYQWNTDGFYLDRNHPTNMDLQLYLVFRYPYVPIPDGAQLSRLQSKKPPPNYLPPDEYGRK